jgi:hypothetical protein
MPDFAVQRQKLFSGEDLDFIFHIIRGGLAWYFRKYAADVPEDKRDVYAAAEKEAKAAKRERARITSAGTMSAQEPTR